MKHVLLLFFFILFANFASAQTTPKGIVTVFPNPATEFISVKDVADGTTFVAVYNLVGKKVKEFEYIKGENYYVSDLPKGLYVVQIMDKNKNVSATVTVRKQ